MRLKTIHGRTMQEAMELVRQQLGAEAIIVATHEDEGTRGVRVTAASDAEDAGMAPGEPALTYETLQLISNALDDHGTPPELIDSILNAIAGQTATDPHMALSGALDTIFDFRSLPEDGVGRPVMLIGPPGGGKTAAVGKMAARAVLAGNTIRLITTDTVRARGIEQLEAYAARLGLDVMVAPDPLALIEAVETCNPEELIVIDTMGVNPYSEDDMTKLTDFTGAISVDTTLVLSAGRDPIEAMDTAKAYEEASPGRMLVTGLDMVRRLGSILAAAHAADLAFSDVSPSPNIVNGLRPINPVSLARLLLPAEPLGQKIPRPAGDARAEDIAAVGGMRTEANDSETAGAASELAATGSK